MNHRGGLWNVHCVVTVVLGKQLIFKSAVIRSTIFLVVSNPYLTYNSLDLHVLYFYYSIHKNNIGIKSSSVNTPCFILEAHNTHIWLAPLQEKTIQSPFLPNNSKTYRKTVTHPPLPPAHLFQQKNSYTLSVPIFYPYPLATT